jgi:hypothetical protein
MQNQFNGERKSFQQIASELDIHKQWKQTYSHTCNILKF